MPSFNSPTPQVRLVNPFPNVPNPNNQMEMYERDKRELQQRNAELYKILYKYENSMSNRSIRYDLPSQFGARGTEYYQKALEKLNEMLRGETPINLKDAVFTVENAFFENRLDYSKFDNAIQNLAQTAQLKTMQEGYNWKNPMTKNVMLFRAMADTLEIKVSQKETSIQCYEQHNLIL